MPDGRGGWWWAPDPPAAATGAPVVGPGGKLGAAADLFVGLTQLGCGLLLLIVAAVAVMAVLR